MGSLRDAGDPSGESQQYSRGSGHFPTEQDAERVLKNMEAGDITDARLTP